MCKPCCFLKSTSFLVYDIRECAEIFAAHQKIDLLLEVCYLFVDAFYFLYRCVIVNSFLNFINHQFLHSILFHSRVLSAASLQLRISPPLNSQEQIYISIFGSLIGQSGNQPVKLGC